MTTQAKSARSSRSAARSSSRASKSAPRSKGHAPPSAQSRPDAVPLRARHDGWTPDRQLGFIDALAASGCVAEAAAAVGMDRTSAYRLRARPEAQQFRLARDAALDMAVRAVTDACFSRAINGVPVPHFYKGEQIGEHRRYDNRLAMFLMRYRDPLRYAATLDKMVYTGHTERAGVALARARNRLLDEAHGAEILDDEPAGLPYAMEPVAIAEVRQTEQAIIEGSSPIYGDHSRRWRLQEARTKHREKQKREAVGRDGRGS